MNKRILAISMVMVIGMLALSAFSWPPSHTTSSGWAVYYQSERSNYSGYWAFAADAARYTAMAEFFAAKEAAGIQRSHAADAARYTAMAEFFAAKEAAGIQRSRAADAARYNAMAKHYTASFAR